MATLRDDFNRADANPMSGNWSGRGVGSNLQISSNQSAGTTNGTINSLYWNADTFGPNCETSITIATIPATNRYFRLFLRLSNAGAAGETGYMMQWTRSAVGLTIHRETARETYTQIAQNASTTCSNGDIFAFRIVGSQLTAYKNGASELTISDSTYSAAGRIAFGCGDTTTRMDDFGAATILGGQTQTVVV